MTTLSIPLTQDKVALVDESDHAHLSQWKWFALRSHQKWYAARMERVARGKQRHVLMHRYILQAPDEREVDHANGDTLDNRRCNLRLATPSQNRANMPLHKPNPTGYRGVHRRESGRFRAQISDARQLIRLGTYDTAEEAARAYDAKAREIYGAFAHLNFPSEIPE